VTFVGRWHKLDDIGVNQLPPRLPILIGTGNDERLLQRVARLGDGWIPLWDPVEALPALHRFLEAEGKDVSTFEVATRFPLSPDGPKAWVEAARRLHAAGVTDLSLGYRSESRAESLAKIIEARDLLRREFG